MLTDGTAEAEPLPSTPLRRVALEVEQHVAADGWDQAPRLFALVPTRVLAEREPSLAAQLAIALRDDPDGLTPVEQDELPDAPTFEEGLLGIEWPPVVAGCAVVVERVMLPPEAEGDLPDDPEELARVVADHPQRQDVRLVAAVTRDGERHSMVRGRSATAELLEGPDLVPGLVEQLLRTVT
ncbi:MAG: PPA1309 family protein [Aeromicrobium erythreum]